MNTEFERQVTADLAELKTDMKSLIGNGQPGRIGRLENWVLRLIIGFVVLAVLTLGGPAVIAWLK